MKPRSLFSDVTRILLLAALAFGLAAPQPVHAATAGTITVSPVIQETSTTDLGDGASWTYGTPFRYVFTSGSGSNQASKVYQDSVTLAGSGASTIDLDGSLTGPLATISFTRIYSILIYRTDAYVASTQDENLLISGDFILTKYLVPGADTLAAVTIPVGPNGLFYVVFPGPTGIAVTATTGDQITVTNASSADSCTFKIIVQGS